MDQSDERTATTDGLPVTRRTAMSMLGVGWLGATVASRATAAPGNDQGESTGKGEGTRSWNRDVDAMGHDLKNLGSLDAETATIDHVYTAARDADRIVWKDDAGTFHADGPNGEVASGDDMIAVINGALKSLTEGRTSKEKVAVVSPGTVGPAETIKQVSIPSYTVLDMPVTMTIEDEGEPFVIPGRLVDVEHVDIPNFNVAGNPRYGILGNSVSNVHIGHVNLLFDGTGLGVRIDQYGNDGRSTNVQITSGYAKNTGHHAFELNGVTRAQLGQLVAENPANAGLNMDHTIDATVNSVIGLDPGHPSTYATVRLANFCHNVSVGQVVSRGGAKGLMLITARNASFGEVNIEGSTDSGVFIAISSDVSISGGVIKNCRGEAIRVHGYPQDTFRWNIPVEGITISNVRIFDDQPDGEKTQTYAIRESGPTAFNNQFVHNDVRGGGTKELIAVSSSSSVVDRNLGAGIDQGTITLSPGGDVATRVPEISSNTDVTLDLRAKPYETPSARFSWDEYFEWDPNASAWELVIEWRTDPGEAIELDYIVDRPQANLDRMGYRGNWDEYAIEGPKDPHV